MMEVILIIGVAVVLVYLYYTLHEYLKNPLKNFPTPSVEPLESVPDLYALPSPLEALKSSEQGVMAMLVGEFASKLHTNALSQALIEVFLKDLSQMGVESKNLQSLREIYASKDHPGLEKICAQLLQLAHGEYKKRVKLVEFLLVLAYSDGALGEAEKEAVLDVGAFLRLENADFNQLYDSFEKLGLEPMILDQQEASEILACDAETLDAQFHQKVDQCHLNFLEPKNWNKSYIPEPMKALWQLQQAYSALQSDPTKVSLKKTSPRMP